MVAERDSRRVPASYLAGASCQLPDRAPALLNRLTSAQRLVAVHVAQGLSNKEVCAVLGKAEPTVKHQLQGAMRALGVQSRCQLIVLLLRG